MTRPFLGPRLIVGTLLGVAIGLLATFNIYCAGAVVLIGLYLLGNHRQHQLAEEHTHSAEARQNERYRWLDAQIGRNQYWLRFPLDSIPGETRKGRHLDRVFTPYTECDQGHIGFHRMGVLFTRDGADRVARVCAEPGCTCTWSELLIGGAQ